jgi:hypothetical protein
MSADNLGRVPLICQLCCDWSHTAGGTRNRDQNILDFVEGRSELARTSYLQRTHHQPSKVTLANRVAGTVKIASADAKTDDAEGHAYQQCSLPRSSVSAGGCQQNCD